jgi:hypothetical protein
VYQRGPIGSKRGAQAHEATVKSPSAPSALVQSIQVRRVVLAVGLFCPRWPWPSSSAGGQHRVPCQTAVSQQRPLQARAQPRARAAVVVCRLDHAVVLQLWLCAWPSRSAPSPFGLVVGACRLSYEDEVALSVKLVRAR